MNVTGATPTPAPTVDFSSIASQAKDMINTESAASGASTASVPLQPAVVNPVAQPQQPAISATPPSTPGVETTPVVAPPTVEPTFQVDLGNGRVEALTQTQLKELYQNGLRQADYTRKTQELAQQRQQIEQYVQSVQAAILQQQNTPQGQQQQVAQQPIDPNQPVTMGQLQQMMQTVQQSYGVVSQQAQQYVEDRLQVADYAERINSTLNDLYKEQPVLKALPEYEDIMRYRVAQMKPQTIEDTITAFRNVAKEISTAAQAPFQAQQQQQAALRTNLAATASEPPGGVAPQQQAQSYMRTDKRDLDWTKLNQAAKSLVGV